MTKYGGNSAVSAQYCFAPFALSSPCSMRNLRVKSMCLKSIKITDCVDLNLSRNEYMLAQYFKFSEVLRTFYKWDLHAFRKKNEANNGFGNRTIKHRIQFKSNLCSHYEDAHVWGFPANHQLAFGRTK